MITKLKGVYEFAGNSSEKVLVGQIIDDTYFTRRKQEHYFRIFQGFGLSVSVYNELIAEGVKKVIIRYHGTEVEKKLVSDLNKWKSSTLWENQLVNSQIDPQYILPEKEMEVVRLVELKGGNEQKNMETKQPFNYAAARKDLEETSKRPPFWKPTVGQHAVKIISEFEEFKFKDKETGEEEDRLKLRIEVGGQEYVWSMGYGQTKASLYGQLLQIAEKHGDKLSGTTVKLAVKNSGKKNEYFVLD